MSPVTQLLQAMSRNQTHQGASSHVLPLGSLTEIKGNRVQSLGNILPVFASFSVMYINSKSKRGSGGIKVPAPPKDNKELS